MMPHPMKSIATIGLFLSVSACAEQPKATTAPEGKEKAQETQQPKASDSSKQFQIETISISPAISHELLDEVLKTHVDENGMVDYAAMAKDEKFQKYLDWLAKTDAKDLPSSDDKMAFWINAYNASVIRGVLDLLPEDQSKWPDFKVTEAKNKDGVGFFRINSHTIGGVKFHLDEMEKCMLWNDEDYAFQQPRETSFYTERQVEKPDIRAHFVLVCAARSCPKLQREAMVGPRVLQQMIDATREFVSDPQNVTVTPSQQLISVSKIITWFYSQFTNGKFEGGKGTLNWFLAEYVKDPELAKTLKSGSWRIKHDKEYDWRLNLQK